MLGRRPPTVVGLDEAGRGAWIGPLVVGAVAVPRERLADIAGTGARDSKQLSPDRREEVYGRLEGVAELRSAAATPPEVDRFVVDGRLNELEATLFGRLAREFSPAEVRADACDTNAHRFGEAVRRHAGAGMVVVARHHADATEPLVGAASIVAKVRRDRAIRELSDRLGEDVGSGYPSDPTTVAFVRRSVRPGTPMPEWLRASWKTTRRVIGGEPPRAVRRLGR